MKINRFVALFFALVCALHAQQAEAERAKIEAFLRAPVEFEVQEINRSSLPGIVDRATIDERVKRLRGEFLAFLREKTEATNNGNRRVIKSPVLWSFIFNVGSDDGAAYIDDQTGSTMRLIETLKRSSLGVEMEADSAKRATMVGRITTALADLEAWRKHDANARSARGRISFSLPALVRPL